MRELRWGILSTARIGTKKVIPAMQKADRCRVTAIASRDGERARAAAAELGIPLAFDAYDELLASTEVDAVYIPLPNHLHKEWTLRAAEAGKHVLCEKPLALNANDAAGMVEACGRAGVLFMEAFMYRLHPSWQGVVDMVREGRIGDLRAIQVRFAYFNDDPTDIRNQADIGGGALMDIGCYPINVARLLFDAEPRRVEAVMVRQAEFGTDVLTTALLEFDGGHASFTVSTLAAPDQRVVLLGTGGMIEVEIPFNIPPDRPARVFLTVAGGSPGMIEYPVADQYTIEAELFARAVIDGEPVPIPPSDGVANMAAIERILAAAR